jgi:hypothetical protein
LVCFVGSSIMIEEGNMIRPVQALLLHASNFTHSGSSRVVFIWGLSADLRNLDRLADRLTD